MVLLTITPAVIEALGERNKLGPVDRQVEPLEDEPSLRDPKPGNPISHGQVVDLWKDMQRRNQVHYTLETLLAGARIYVPPPTPKPEPVSLSRHPEPPFSGTDGGWQSDEYKALMARLRREEEERKYQRMVSAPPPTEVFSQRFPHAALAHSFAEVNRPVHAYDMGDDDVTINDVHRQLMLILNFLVSILGCAATLWIVARWWSTPARLFLTMGGSLVVAIAEVAVYSGYIWHLDEAKKKDATFKEVKQVVQTWSVGGDGARREEHKTILLDSTPGAEDSGVRKRTKATT